MTRIGPTDALAGTTVVDLTRYLPGPYCTRLLADLGASVIKIEGPSGDPMRAVAWYEQLNAGKRIVTLDLCEQAGRQQFHALLAHADICVEGFRPSTAKALGVDAATLAARHPHLVLCSISGYNASGPDADRAGHDLNYQADAGLLGPTPRVPQLLVADVTGGLRAAIAILAALVRRGRSSALRSDVPAREDAAAVRISLHEAAASWAPFMPPPVLRGEHACYNVYETADREWVALGALEPKFWARFCRHVGRPEWIDVQFAEDRRRIALLEDVRDLFRTRTAAEWQADLTPLDCCFTRIPSGPIS
jgi:alpha-methylacyl-CoA racemase